MFSNHGKGCVKKGHVDLSSSTEKKLNVKHFLSGLTKGGVEVEYEREGVPGLTALCH